MAKNNQIFRLINISNFLKSKGSRGATYDEVYNYLEKKHLESDSQQPLAFSEKTFKRDRNTLRDLLDIEIAFKRSTLSYHIIPSDSPNEAELIMDNLCLINAYKTVRENNNVMLFESRLSSGLINIEELTRAIKYNQVISFDYSKFWDNKTTRRVVEPYALKEFKYRWYLLAKEHKSDLTVLKTFGLDRITNIELHSSRFQKEIIDFEQLYKNAFGIILDESVKAEKITLSFKKNQAAFIKSLPLHHSQKIVKETDFEIVIELFLAPTYDFYQELLTHYERLKIIAPEKVRAEFLKCLSIAQKINI